MGYPGRSTLRALRRVTLHFFEHQAGVLARRAPQHFPCSLRVSEVPCGARKSIQQEYITMSVEENVQLMRRWFEEVWNQGRIETVHELLSTDAVARGQNGAESELRGPQEFEGFVRQIRGAFPDIRVRVEDVFGADDKAV